VFDRSGVEDRYPFTIPALRETREIVLDPAVTVLVGENGTGKSTIVEALAVAAGFNPEGGSLNMVFETRATHSPLHERVTLVRGGRRPRTGYFLRAESFYNVATTIDDLDAEPGGQRLIDAYGGVSLHERSHGESFLALAVHRFGPGGLYVLDEPEAALSVKGCLGLLARMHDLVLEGSQFVLATHSPILMAYPDATILELSDDGLRPVAWADVEHVQLTRAFLDDPDRLFRHLFD
jgi:predicted ATPase